MKRRLYVLALCFCATTPVIVKAQDEVAVTTNAAVKIKGRHFVGQKPERPTFTKVESPGPNFFYIEDEWKWSSKTNLWEWAGNRWDAIPAAGQKWINGRWVESPEGWYWQTGYWKGE